MNVPSTEPPIPADAIVVDEANATGEQLEEFIFDIIIEE